MNRRSLNPDKKIKEVDCKILSNERIGEKIYLLWLEAPFMATRGLPGQFVNIDVRGNDVFFRRPFSIAGVEGNNISILYRVVGRGTKEMSKWGIGDYVNLVGPLGTRFPLPESPEITSVLIAGGVGAAPLIYLNNLLVENNYPVILYIGARTAAEHFKVINKGAEPILSTDDASLGRKGNIVQVFEKDFPLIPKPIMLYSCGPEAMIIALTKLSIRMDIPHSTALERLMACGLGICQGCVVSVKNGAETHYNLVCKDGPIFEASRIYPEKR